jgi:hypothetical protein
VLPLLWWLDRDEAAVDHVEANIRAFQEGHAEERSAIQSQDLYQAFAAVPNDSALETRPA